MQNAFAPLKELTAKLVLMGCLGFQLEDTGLGDGHIRHAGRASGVWRTNAENKKQMQH